MSASWRFSVERASVLNSYRRLVWKSNKDAVSASWIRFGRAPMCKIYKKMYTVDRIFDVELLVIHQKIASHHIKASTGAIYI